MKNKERIRVQDSYKRNIKYFILGPFFKTFEAVIDLIIPLIMKAVIDNLVNYSTNQEKINSALIGGSLILGLGIFGFGMTMVCQYFASKASSRVGTDIRNQIYKKIGTLSNKELEMFPQGYFYTALITDTTQVQTGVAMFIRLAFRAPLLIVGSLIISFIYDWQIALIFLAIIPIILGIIFGLMNKSSKKYLKIQEKLDNLSSFSNDTIVGERAIRSFNKEQYQNEQFDIRNKDYLRLGKSVSIINATINPLTFAIINITIILVVFISGFKIENNILIFGHAIEATTITCLIQYLEQIFQAILVLTNIVLIFTRAGTSSKRIQKIFDLDVSVKNSENAIKYKEIKVNEPIIEFNDVSFAYTDSAYPIVKDINFKILKGQSIGIVGGTGAGKTSLINLLMRFIDTDKGVVKYKGEDIKNYDLYNLRNEIGLVLQKSVLFNGTVKSNLLMANPNASDEEIVRALKDSCAYDFIREKEGDINCEVREQGSNFSGGQKQRISIARALIKHSEVLVLDNSTSALDYLTEYKVRQNILHSDESLTKIFISQRSSTVKNCDQIIVMENGKIAGIGNHKSLLKTCTVYKELVQSQGGDVNE